MSGSLSNLCFYGGWGGFGEGLAMQEKMKENHTLPLSAQPRERATRARGINTSTNQPREGEGLHLVWLWHLFKMTRARKFNVTNNHL